MRPHSRAYSWPYPLHRLHPTPFQELTNHRLEPRCYRNSYHHPFFLPASCASRRASSLLCHPGLSRKRFSLWRSVASASTVECGKQRRRLSGRDSKTMAVGTNSILKPGLGVFCCFFTEWVNSSRGCCPCLCVDKMAPRQLSALAIMASYCREGEVRRCGWGWGAAGNGFLFFQNFPHHFHHLIFLQKPTELWGSSL